MNYAGGKFEADVLGSHLTASFDFVPLPHHIDADTVTIPDAHLLFAGRFERSGTDLIISDREHRFVVNDYFHGDKRPILISPDGAPLDAKVVEALTGHTAYAQAGTPPAPKLIGHVVKLTGSASIVRNGVTVEVNVADNLYQNDVVQTGSSSTLGLVLDDGSTFNLSANSRFMLNDLVYDANSTSNSSLMTLIQGAASFVAGQVAPTGDMKVCDPHFRDRHSRHRCHSRYFIYGWSGVYLGCRSARQSSAYGPSLQHPRHFDWHRGKQRLRPKTHPRRWAQPNNSGHQ